MAFVTTLTYASVTNDQLARTACPLNRLSKIKQCQFSSVQLRSCVRGFRFSHLPLNLYGVVPPFPRTATVRNRIMVRV